MRPKSVISWLTATPAAARGKMMGLFNAPAVMRLPAWESAAVTLREALGSRAERDSRTFC